VNRRIGRQVKVTLPDDTIAELDRIGREEGRERADLMREAIMERFPVVYVPTIQPIDLTDM
jgi:hypothetical protein